MVRSDLRLQAAVVFGSVARGDFNRWSDVDLLLVADSLAGSESARCSGMGPPLSDRYLRDLPAGESTQLGCSRAGT
jgi:predicted nucleotidyltransferase